MVDITHRQIVGDTVDVAGRTVHITGTETKLEISWGFGGWGWSYRRPSRVSLEDDPSTGIVLRDYVMLNRLAIVLIALVLFTRRRA